MVGLLTIDGRSLWRFPHSQTTAVASWSPRCRQGQRVLEATSGTVQTAEQMISRPTVHLPPTEHTCTVWTPPPPPAPAANYSNSLTFIRSARHPTQSAESKTLKTRIYVTRCNVWEIEWYRFVLSSSLSPFPLHFLLKAFNRLCSTSIMLNTQSHLWKQGLMIHCVPG